MISSLSQRTHTARQQQATEQYDRTGAEIASRLAASGYGPLRTIRCEVHGGVTTLSGTVPSYHLKQVAQNLAGRLDGVTQVRNRLLVQSER